MGQKTHPIGFRLGISKPWRSQWYANRDYPALLKEDQLLRKYLKARLGHAAIADIRVERKPGKVVVTVHTGRPGVVPTSDFHGGPVALGDGTELQAHTAGARADRARMSARGLRRVRIRSGSGSSAGASSAGPSTAIVTSGWQYSKSIMLTST